MPLARFQEVLLGAEEGLTVDALFREFGFLPMIRDVVLRDVVLSLAPQSDSDISKSEQ